MLFFFLSKHRISQRESWGKEGSGCCWGAFDNLFWEDSALKVQTGFNWTCSYQPWKPPEMQVSGENKELFFSPNTMIIEVEGVVDDFVTGRHFVMCTWLGNLTMLVHGATISLSHLVCQSTFKAKYIFMATISCRLIGLFVKKLYGAASMGEWKTHLP